MPSHSAFNIPAGLRFSRHEHDRPHLCFVLRGGFLERDGKSWVDVGSGSLRVSGGAKHDIEFGPDGARCVVLEGEVAEWASLPRARFISSDGWLQGLATRLNVALDHPDPAHRTTIDALTAELKAQVSRRLAGRWSYPPAWLVQARSLVWHDADAGVAQIADRVGIHRVHLARAFRDHYGASVSEYAGQVRLARAQRLLCSTHLPLSRVAFEAGFADQAHLTRVLRRATGETPGTLRRAALHGFNTAIPAHG